MESVLVYWEQLIAKGFQGIFGDPLLLGLFGILFAYILIKKLNVGSDLAISFIFAFLILLTDVGILPEWLKWLFAIGVIAPIIYLAIRNWIGR